MAVLAEDVIRSLASFRGEQAPVTTCYLDVDGRRLVRHHDLEVEVDRMLRSARSRASGDSSVTTDLRRIEAYVKAGFDRSHTRGLAIFACAAHDLWEVIPLPVAVQNRVIINHAPAVAALEQLFEESEAFAFLLADRQRARVLVFELGEMTERTELIDELPRDYDVRGEKDQGDPHRHIDDLRHQHLRRAADAAWRVFQERGFEHLAVSGPDVVAAELEGLLHPYLRERLRGRLHMPVTSSIDEIRTAAMEWEARIEREREAQLVERLREAVATGRKGIAGLAPVLAALADHRVEQLVVSQGFAENGWWCEADSTLAEVGRRCPRCGKKMAAVDDVVEEAIEHALANGCRVQICVGNADLDVLGRIGAFLRY